MAIILVHSPSCKLAAYTGPTDIPEASACPKEHIEANLAMLDVSIISQETYR